MNVTKKIPFWLGLVIILVISLVVVIIVTALVPSDIWSLKFLRPPDENPETQPQPQPSSEILSCLGKIQSKNDQGFVIKALAVSNPFDQDKDITIKVLPGTHYTSMSAPQTLPKDITQEQLNKLFQSQIIALADLKVGDQVVVFSQTDIAGKTEIEVVRVQRVSSQ